MGKVVAPITNHHRARFVTLYAREKTPQAIAALVDIVEGKGKEMDRLREILDREGVEDRDMIQASNVSLAARLRAATEIVKAAALGDARLEDLLPNSSQQGAPEAMVHITINNQGRERLLVRDQHGNDIEVSAEDVTVHGDVPGQRIIE